MAGHKNHAYHILPPSIWPLTGAVGAIVMLFGAVLWMHGSGPWMALIGPAGLPPAQVQRYYQAMHATLATKEVQDALGAQGIALVGMAPEKTEPFFKTELAKHAALVKKAGAVKD